MVPVLFEILIEFHVFKQYFKWIKTSIKILQLMIPSILEDGLNLLHYTFCLASNLQSVYEDLLAM